MDYRPLLCAVVKFSSSQQFEQLQQLVFKCSMIYAQCDLTVLLWSLVLKNKKYRTFIIMSSGFITEFEAADIRKRRQDEWERVRKADDPLVRPEEPYDCRSLYEKLQEQKQKRDLEYEEAHKLKNMIKGLDDDEIEFLDLVDRTKLEADRKKELEEELELNDYRNRVAILQEKSIEDRLQAEIVVNKVKIPTNNRTSQQKLLKGVVVVKKNETQKRKMSGGDENNTSQNETEAKHIRIDETSDTSTTESNGAGVTIQTNAALKCVAILPGLGSYDYSSSEENSSESEIDSKPPSTIDLLGRKIVKKGNQTPS